MKILILVISLFLVIQCQSNLKNAKGHMVKIVLDTEEPLPDQDTIYITGNVPIFGEWHTKGLPMVRRAEMRWEKSFGVPDSTHLQFKFTLGNMGKEAISNRGVIPGNSELMITEDKEVYFVLEDWKHTYVPSALDSMGK